MLLGRVMLVKPVQPQNAYHPMLVTLSGMVTLVKLIQSLNAYVLIVATLSGIVKNASFLLAGY